MNDVFLDALFDTLKLLPFLLLIYVVIELIEHKTTLFGNRKILQGKLAPLLGSAAGLIPLCGFSVMAAKLYDKKYIRTGTLMAVFIATSDEAVILLLSDVTNMTALSAIFPLLVIKFVLAVGVGYAATAILFKERANEIAPVEGHADYECGHEHEHEYESPLKLYLLNPLMHALKVALYVLVINFVFGYVIELIGEENIVGYLSVNIYLQPLLTAAVGLIPSCASSVILTSSYTGGMITFGSMVAGLVVNAGMGFMILFKNPKSIPKALAIMGVLLVVSYSSGALINFIATYIV